MASSGELRQLRRRKESVESTQQITRAMEMIAASRIQKAIRRLEASLPYAQQIHDIIKGLAATADVVSHPLIAPHETVETVGLCINTSDRGLAGAYNANVFRQVEELISRQQDQGRDVRLYMIGKKGQSYFSFQGWEFAETWGGFTEEPAMENALDIAETLMEDYREETIDEVRLVYTDFQGQMTQKATSLRILPVDEEEFAGGEEIPPDFIFEPDPESILDRLIPRFVEAMVFSSLLESSASEHAMRQRAMKAATENAEELQEDLERELNQARQAQITQEISEIVGGAEALSES